MLKRLGFLFVALALIAFGYKAKAEVTDRVNDTVCSSQCGQGTDTVSLGELSASLMALGAAQFLRWLMTSRR